MRARHLRDSSRARHTKSRQYHREAGRSYQATCGIGCGSTTYRALRAVVVVGLDDLVVDAAGGRRACRGTRVDLRGLVRKVQRRCVGAVDRPAVLRSGTLARGISHGIGGKENHQNKLCLHCVERNKQLVLEAQDEEEHTVADVRQWVLM
jgi:hypothetical protein